MGKTFKDTPMFKDRLADNEIRNRYQALRYDVDTSLTWEVV